MGKVYAILGFISAAFITVFLAYREGGKSKQNEIKAMAEEVAREYESAGSEALIGGISKEELVKNEAVNNTKRNHFE